jgi:hypothetical protein
MEVDLAKAEVPRDWLTFMEDRLLERSTQDDDNYTAMAVIFNSEAASMPRTAKPRGGLGD